MQTALRAARPASPALLVFLAAVACGGSKGDGGPTGPPPSVASSITAATSLAVEGAPGQPVADRPSVVVRDQRNAPMAGVSVTFAVTAGGGSLTGATVATDASGTATVGSWTLGPEPGPNTLTATAGSLTPVTFTANASLPLAITAISPDTIVPGGTMTITGTGFNTIMTLNLVRVDGVVASVTAASASQLVVTVPTGLGCGGNRNVEVAVNVASSAATRQHPASLPDEGAPRSLAPGELLVLHGSTATRCNSLTNPGRYMLSVFNSSMTHTPTGAAYELRGTNAAAAGASHVRVAEPGPLRSVQPGGAAFNLFPREEEHREEAHLRLLEENTQFLRQNRSALRGIGARRTIVPGEARALAVGDIVAIKVPAVQRGGFCTNHQPISTRVAFVGPRSVVLEDVNNPLAGQIDSTYQSIGQEYEAVMHDILVENFGDPLVWDAQSSNKGRVAMVFTRYVNDSIPGVAGFVVSCDLFDPNGVPAVPSSNYGPHFYAMAPTVAGTLGGAANNPPNWRWRMRPTIIHEVKHVVSFASRIANNAQVFEEQWLEESSARLSEELYERRRFVFAQRANIPYGSALDQRGPWCGVRACGDQPRGFVRAFEDLYLSFYNEPHRRSPIGRLNANDFSFYNTGWALIRWAADRSNMSEGAFFTALTQSNVSGIANLQARTGRTFAEMLPEWLMSMALDDRPGVPASGAVDFPSWDMRSVFAGLQADFPATYPVPWPLAQSSVAFGNFLLASSVVPGAGSFTELSGTMGAPQLLELRATGGGPAPDQLGIAIFRIE